MPLSTTGWQALRRTPSPLPAGAAHAGAGGCGEEEGGKGKKKIRNPIRSRSGSAGRAARCRAVPEVSSAPAERWPLPWCPCAFVYVSLHADAEVAPAGTALFPVRRGPPPPPPSSLLVASAAIFPFGGVGVVLCALPRQEGRERGPSDYAKDFFPSSERPEGRRSLSIHPTAY